MVKSEARCEGCRRPLTVAHAVERSAAFSDQRRLYLPPSCALKSALGEDYDVKVVLVS